MYVCMYVCIHAKYFIATALPADYKAGEFAPWFGSPSACTGEGCIDAGERR